MSVAASSSPQAASAAATGRRPHANAEAARYGVLRRLGPALKHDMVVNLQAVAMMAEVLNARLERGTPSPAEFEASISKMNRLAREGVMACLKVAAWIAPSEDEGVRLRDGVEECVGLLRSGFNFRGFTLANDVPETEFEVSRVALRHLVAASLLTLTDTATGSGDVTIAADIAAGFALVTLRCTPRQDDTGPDSIAVEPNYRKLDWQDVQALAQAEGVELFRTAGEIAMRVPRMVATTPLQIAPL